MSLKLLWLALLVSALVLVNAEDEVKTEEFASVCHPPNTCVPVEYCLTASGEFLTGALRKTVIFT